MSGLRSIADWALGGGSGASNDDDLPPVEGPSEDELRAKRMARLAALETTSRSNSAPKSDDTSANVDMDVDGGGDTRPMDIDDSSPRSSLLSTTSSKRKTSPVSVAPTTVTKSPAVTTITPPVVVPVDPLAKHRRRKALLIRRILHITYGTDDAATIGTGGSSAHNCVKLTLDDDFDAADAVRCPSGIASRHVAELLTARLSLSPTSRELASTMPPQTNLGLIAYLGGCHRRAGEEIRELKQGMGSAKFKDSGEGEMCDILEQIKSQVVSYAASSLMVPDLFELGADATLQLAKCLSAASMDLTTSITFDALGKNTSFYHCVCEEIYSQGSDEFASVIGDVVKHITVSLAKCTSLMDEGIVVDGGVGGSGLSLVSALRELCTNKRAVVALANLPSFLLPPASSPAANERVETMSDQQMTMMRMMMQMRGEGRSSLGGGYLRRSGPALEKDTILGLVLRLGFPHDIVAPSFSNAATRSRRDVSNITNGFRRQLEGYQAKCNDLVKQLVVTGEESRKQVIQWLIDALLVNVNADATRPDRTKVCSEELLVNLSAIMLKLCEPFVNDAKKATLIDPGLVCSPESHGGIYDLAGDNALPRLGENVTNDGVTYSPKNSFVPLCFFFCTRSLALSVVPGGDMYENISRQVSHTYRQIRGQNGDPRNDPRFDRILQFQYSKEVVMMSEAYIADVSRFYNMAAGILLKMTKDQLKTMPEHIVDDMCSVLVYASNFAGKMLSGLDFGNIFRLTVTLLSKEYSHVSSDRILIVS